MLPTLRLGFVVTPPSLRAAVHKAKQVTDWHTATPLQMALARFIDDGGFARHIRKMRGVYRIRHEMVTNALTGELADHLEVLPSACGLHVAALARTASTDEIGAVVRRASHAGVAVQELSMGRRGPGSYWDTGPCPLSTSKKDCVGSGIASALEGSRLPLVPMQVARLKSIPGLKSRRRVTVRPDGCP
jgi:hypothetical protein